MSYTTLFQERYDKLNASQKEAVNTIYGPIMVVAGPGTGKTEVLSLRIANMLQSDAQIDAQNILCLTYTDEAAHNMRKRLESIVGVQARNVSISTFHGFCNNVIQNNLDYFDYRSLEPISDLERAEIGKSLLDKITVESPLFRVGRAEYYDFYELKKFIDFMKKENKSTQEVEDAIDLYIKSLPERPEFQYKVKRGTNNKGDVKQKEVDAAIKSMERTRAALKFYTDYCERLKLANRYDFTDMILWVIDAFNKFPHLLAKYQERYQYILVDEFQDTNGAQKEILNLLCQYWGLDANIFIVGDDDQSIYEFQGARIQNIVEFYTQYQSKIKLIVLSDNYRSTQPILDAAMRSIRFNEGRLINLVEDFDLTKNIVSSAERFQHEETLPQPKLIEYLNPIQESYDIACKIEALIHAGTPKEEIAVLYYKHDQASSLVKLLEAKQIPYRAAKTINVLEQELPLIITRILRYVQQELKRMFSGEAMLFELLYCPCFKIDVQDIITLQIHISDKNTQSKGIKHWRQLLNNEIELSHLELKNLNAIIQLNRCLDTIIQQSQVLRLPMMIEKIIHECGLIQWAMDQADPVFQLDVLHTFINFATRNFTAHSRIEHFFDVLEQMKMDRIDEKLTKVNQEKKVVNLLTIHSAKGLEFEHVFVIGLQNDVWEDARNNSSMFKLPDTLFRTRKTEKEINDQIESKRRLFFVALTRAKKFLQLSYAAQSLDGKSKEGSVFLSEIFKPDELQKIQLDKEEGMQAIINLLQEPKDVYIHLIDQSIIDQRLEHFELSPTALNAYINCPIDFYFNNIVRAPFASNDSMAFGTSIHFALEHTFKRILQDDGQYPDLDTVLTLFKLKMKDLEINFTPTQFEKRTELGIHILKGYYELALPKAEKNVELERFVKARLGDIPLKGKIDKIELLENNQCNVIDYKTGKTDKEAKTKLNPPNRELGSLGGDYWRQMMFYKLLIEKENYSKLKVSKGVFEYLEAYKDQKEMKEEINMSDAGLSLLEEQIQTYYAKIKNREFQKGCGDARCRWCNFVKANKINIPAPIQTDSNVDA